MKDAISGEDIIKEIDIYYQGGRSPTNGDFPKIGHQETSLDDVINQQDLDL